MLGSWLDLMILKVFSNLNDSIILCSWGKVFRVQHQRPCVDRFLDWTQQIFPEVNIYLSHTVVLRCIQRF